MTAYSRLSEAVNLLAEFVYTGTTQYPDGRVEPLRHCQTTGDNDGQWEDVCIYCGGRHEWAPRLMWDWIEHGEDCPWVAAAIYLDETGYVAAMVTLPV